MRWFKFVDQAPDGHIERTISDEEILLTYFPYWAEQMRKVGKGEEISEAECIRDFVVVNWAEEVVPDGY